jgi:hypothetical protein
MKNTSWLNCSISILFGITVWVFFGIFYRHHLHYQEEIQLFLTTSDYFFETLTYPGGLAVYFSRLFTQFFIDSFAGALCIALLLIALQQLVWRVSIGQVQSRSKKSSYYLLSFIPSIVYACALMDENFLLTALIALIFALIAVLRYNQIKLQKVRYAYLLLMIPLLYWLIGSVCIVFGMIVLLKEWTEKEKSNKLILSILSISAIAIYVLSVLISKICIVQYPVARLWLAGEYYRFPGVFPIILLSILLLVILIPVLFKYLPEKSSRKSRLFIGGIQLILIVLLAGWGLKAFADWGKEEVLAYDYFARMKKWNSIINIADKKTPNGPLSVATLNLALAQKNYLPEYMFHYIQNGPEGLLPNFQKEYIMDMMVGEIYYHLGLINTAQRFAFEGMEAIPGYQKSVRSIRRLAETNLINGQYEVAAKYLSILEHTLFYRQWAKETSIYLYNEEKINAHPEWGTLRQFRPKEDFLFSEQEKDMMMGILYQRNPDNRMAYEYLLAYTLLKKDLPHFFDYYHLEKRGPEEAPESYREALAFIWGQTNFNPEMRPAGIDDRTVIALKSFSEAYRKNKDSEKLLYKQYGKTYWYYLVFKYK